MNNSMYAQAIDEIEKSKCVTLEIREKYFKGKDFKEIRNWLEEQNIDRHTAIEIKSAGILLYISMSNLSCGVNNDGISKGIDFDILVSSTPYS